MSRLRAGFAALRTRLRRGTQPGTSATPAVRFVVIGVARSGSTMLGSLLNSHSRATAFGELFREGDAIGWDLPHLDARDPADLALYREDPVRFLEEDVFGRRAARMRAVGFKLFYYHARNEPFARIWDWLRSDPAIHIIHIKRENALAQYLSLERAHRTGRWVAGQQGDTVGTARVAADKRSPDPFRLDPDDCARHFAWLRQQEEETDALFADHPILQVSYEGLAADLSRESARIQAFLGLPQEQLSVATRRQLTIPLPEAIANFGELRHRFAGTPYSSYFDSSANRTFERT